MVIDWKCKTYVHGRNRRGWWKGDEPKWRRWIRTVPSALQPPAAERSTWPELWEDDHLLFRLQSHRLDCLDGRSSRRLNDRDAAPLCQSIRLGDPSAERPTALPLQSGWHLRVWCKHRLQQQPADHSNRTRWPATTTWPTTGPSSSTLSSSGCSTTTCFRLLFFSLVSRDQLGRVGHWLWPFHPPSWPILVFVDDSDGCAALFKIEEILLSSWGWREKITR